MSSVYNFILNNDSLRHFFSGRKRFKLAWVVCFLLIFTVKQFPQWPGVAFCFLGAMLRFVSSGFLRKEAALAVGGPYSHTRNPLYFGTLMMAAGAVWSVSAWWIALISALLFSLNYYYVIDFEESKLPSYFGQAYLRYCELVPRFWPRLTRPDREELLKINQKPETYVFSWSLAMHNKAFEAVWSFLGIILGVALVYWAKQKLGFIPSVS